jgi:hypothetical protein
MKSSKSSPLIFELESLVKYSKLELILDDSKLEFNVEPKFPTILIERCLVVEIQLFGLLLSKSVELKLLFDSIDPYIGSPMLIIEYFY